ncbi:hypothetical protein ACFQ80_05965 [Isoptericola sp. NPDC056578]|uniref:hypothetical protein n=1 Tax=Isoptericola sp. NPDC056578 TaxID=3345870 RepID=UPI0036A37862
MSSAQGRAYGYEQVAERLHQVFGVRPAASTLRAAVATSRTSTTSRRPSITTGMPAPMPKGSARRVLFDADEIEEWLDQHPWRRRDQVLHEAAERLRRGEDESAVVEGLRRVGVSWSEVAQLIRRTEGRHVPKSSVHKRYRSRD